MKKIPKFKSESEERRFWSTADSTRYIDWKRAQRIALPNLRPSLKTITRSAALDGPRAGA